ncbi:hypothetical protein Droror1_Dr00027239 [Drosera rotundifolia]
MLTSIFPKNQNFEALELWNTLSCNSRRNHDGDRLHTSKLEALKHSREIHSAPTLITHTVIPNRTPTTHHYESQRTEEASDDGRVYLVWVGERGDWSATSGAEEGGGEQKPGDGDAVVEEEVVTAS